MLGLKAPLLEEVTSRMLQENPRLAEFLAIQLVTSATRKLAHQLQFLKEDNEAGNRVVVRAKTKNADAVEFLSIPGRAVEIRGEAKAKVEGTLDWQEKVADRVMREVRKIFSKFFGGAGVGDVLNEKPDEAYYRLSYTAGIDYLRLERLERIPTGFSRLGAQTDFSRNLDRVSADQQDWSRASHILWTIGHQISSTTTGVENQPLIVTPAPLALAPPDSDGLLHGKDDSYMWSCVVASKSLAKQDFSLPDLLAGNADALIAKRGQGRHCGQFPRPGRPG